MKFNFYISCENAEEAQACIGFIDEMTMKRGEPLRPEPVFNAVARGAAAESEEMNGGGVVPRKNVSPGEPSIGKIGENAKTAILIELRNGFQPPAKMNEHCKLLWKRGEIRFDGQEYYV